MAESQLHERNLLIEHQIQELRDQLLTDYPDAHGNSLDALDFLLELSTYVASGDIEVIPLATLVLACQPHMDRCRQLRSERIQRKLLTD